jgi:hypothetical protein
LAAGLRCFSRLGLVRLRMAGGRVHGWRYHGREEYPEKQAHLTVDGSWGIHVQLTGLAAWERYYLFLMTDLKSSGALVTRALTEKTWFRGISLGIDPDRFRAFLERAAEGRLPDTLRFAIADWTAALRRTRVRRVFLMDADPRTIELFEHDRRLSGFVERIGDGYLVLVTFDERRLFTLLAEHRILLEYGGEETDA